MVAKPSNLIGMGYVANSFGLQGWVKIKVDTECSDSLDSYKQIYLQLKDGTILSKKVEDSFARESIFHAKLNAINDRDAALALRGATVLVPRDEFPVLDSDEFYWVDLIGLKVVNLQGEELGMVKDLMQTGASDVLVVQAAKDQAVSAEQRLIPFISQFIIAVDMAKKQISVDWGLDYWL